MRGECYIRIEGHQSGNAVRCGRGITDIASHGGLILNLNRADLAGRRFQSVEAARKIRRKDLAPGGPSADFDMGIREASSPELRNRGNVEHRSAERPKTQGREQVCAARKDGGARLGQSGKRFVEGARSQEQQILLQKKRAVIPDGKSAGKCIFYFYNVERIL